MKAQDICDIAEYYSQKAADANKKPVASPTVMQKMHKRRAF
jgi:hypothetical protein